VKLLCQLSSEISRELSLGHRAAAPYGFFGHDDRRCVNEDLGSMSETTLP